jgi:hypothetical protein
MVFGEDAYNQGIQGNHRPWNAQAGEVVNNPFYGAATAACPTCTTSVPAYLVATQVGLFNGTPGGLITGSPNSAPAGSPSTANALKGIYFGPGGVPLQYNYGLNSGSNNVMMGGDWQSSRIDNGLDLDPRLVRQSVYGRASYDVTDDIQVFAVLQWAYAHATTNSNPNRRLANNTILSGNPFIPASVQAQMTALKLPSFVMGTTNADIPRFLANNARHLRRGVVGANGKFEAFGTGLEVGQLLSAEHHRSLDPHREQRHHAVLQPRNRRRHRAERLDRLPFDPHQPDQRLRAVQRHGHRREQRRRRRQIWAAPASSTRTPDPGRRRGHRANGEPFSTWAGPVSVATRHRTPLRKSHDSASDVRCANWLLRRQLSRQRSALL